MIFMVSTRAERLIAFAILSRYEKRDSSTAEAAITLSRDNARVGVKLCVST